ncbi:MAG: methyltransferase domain-containing protein [Deltaproteobacteria bacterium]|nr:methyltransferase domain-containing protein [Deltaproteobacteria bacterium]
MERVLEPELMDSAEEAEAYDRMDHSLPNEAFVARLFDLGARGRMLDIGTGPAHIPLLICARDPEARILAIDAADSMLEVARANIAASPHAGRIILEKRDAKNLEQPDHSFDTVYSNTILHHLPDPLPFLREAWRVLKPGGVLLIRDLFRPESPGDADRLVELHAAGATPYQKDLFRASLRAALTPEELRGMIAEAELPGVEVVIDTDRHMSLQTRRRVERPRLALARPSPRDLRADEEREIPVFERPRTDESPIARVLRPTRWSRRRGAPTDEARRLGLLLTRVERLIDRGEGGGEALALLRTLPKSPFSEPVFHLRAGDAFLNLSELQDAERHFRAAASQDPSSADAWHGLGVIDAELGRYDSMVERWLRVRKLDLDAPRPPWALPEEDFIAVAEAAFESLPPVVKKKLANLPLIATDYPGEALVIEGIDPRVLGLITGVPLPNKGTVTDAPPELDCVHLYQRNIERVSATPDDLREEIRITVIHETGHYFGLTDEDLEGLGLG